MGANYTLDNIDITGDAPPVNKWWWIVGGAVVFMLWRKQK